MALTLLHATVSELIPVVSELGVEVGASSTKSKRTKTIVAPIYAYTSSVVSRTRPPCGRVMQPGIIAYN